MPHLEDLRLGLFQHADAALGRWARSLGVVCPGCLTRRVQVERTPRSVRSSGGGGFSYEEVVVGCACGARVELRWTEAPPERQSSLDVAPCTVGEHLRWTVRTAEGAPIGVVEVRGRAEAELGATAGGPERMMLVIAAEALEAIHTVELADDDARALRWEAANAVLGPHGALVDPPTPLAQRLRGTEEPSIEGAERAIARLLATWIASWPPQRRGLPFDPLRIPLPLRDLAEPSSPARKDVLDDLGLLGFLRDLPPGAVGTMQPIRELVPYDRWNRVARDVRVRIAGPDGARPLPIVIRAVSWHRGRWRIAELLPRDAREDLRLLYPRA